MALIFALSAWMPLAETMCPNILICGTIKEHLVILKVVLLFLSLVRSWSNCFRCMALSKCLPYPNVIWYVGSAWRFSYQILNEILKYKLGGEVPYIMRVKWCGRLSSVEKVVMVAWYFSQCNLYNGAFIVPFLKFYIDFCFHAWRDSSRDEPQGRQLHWFAVSPGSFSSYQFHRTICSVCWGLDEFEGFRDTPWRSWDWLAENQGLLRTQNWQDV